MNVSFSETFPGLARDGGKRFERPYTYILLSRYESYYNTNKKYLRTKLSFIEFYGDLGDFELFWAKFGGSGVTKGVKILRF